MIGGAGNDSLAGSFGNDVLIGGQGDELDFVEVTDKITEGASTEGFDTVNTALAAYTLGANLETLVFFGTANATGAGNALANSLIGNIGDDKLDGGDGNDFLFGSDGKDTLLGGKGELTASAAASATTL